MAGYPKILQLLIDEFGEKYNLYEDGIAPKYQLQRFYKLVGVLLDNCKGYIDNYINMIDVDRCDSDLLPYIAALVGWRINKELPIPRQRQEIKNSVFLYKRKGTKKAIESLIEAVSALQTDVVEYYNNVLFTNTITSTTLNVFDPLVLSNFGMAGDTIDYTPDPNDDRIYLWDVYGVFVNWDGVTPFTEIILNKINRVLGEFNPINSIYRLALLDVINNEVYDSTGVGESYPTEIDTLNSELYDNLFPKYLYTNSLVLLTNSDAITLDKVDVHDTEVESINLDQFGVYSDTFQTNSNNYFTNSLNVTARSFFYEDFIDVVDYEFLTNGSTRLTNNLYIITRP